MTLSPEQADKLHALISPKLGFLHRLRQRMDRVGFIPSDDLRAKVEAAYGALFALSCELHSLSCQRRRPGDGENYPPAK